MEFFIITELSCVHCIQSRTAIDHRKIIARTNRHRHEKVKENAIWFIMAFYPDVKMEWENQNKKTGIDPEEKMLSVIVLRLTCLFVRLFALYYYCCYYYYCYQYHGRKISEIGFSIRIWCHSTHDIRLNVYLYNVQMWNIIFQNYERTLRTK